MNNDEYERIVENIEGEKDYIVKGKVLYRVDNNKELRVIKSYEYEGLMYAMHDNELSAHFGIEATMKRIKDKYYWPNMRKMIEEYVRSCYRCQMRGKANWENELHPIKVEEPFEIIGIDIVGPLEETKSGKKYIVVAIDYFTKWPEARAIKNATAEEVVEFIWEDIICRHGCPRKIISDRGTHFNNKLMTELMDRCGINHRLTTPYHPQANGLVERFNRTLCESLAKLGNKDWDRNIPSVLFAYRTKENKSTKMKPFYVTYGRQERLTTDKDENRITLLQRMEEILHLSEVHEEVKKNIGVAQQKQKDYHDKTVKRAQRFEVGDKVLLYKSNLEKQWSKKLDERWKGPYEIAEECGKGSYWLKEVNGKMLKTPQNGKNLKKYFERNQGEPRIVINGKEVYDRKKFKVSLVEN